MAKKILGVLGAMIAMGNLETMLQIDPTLREIRQKEKEEHEGRITSLERKHMESNRYKKCFLPECQNTRKNDTKLYCSAECCNKHRLINKLK